MKFFMNTEPKLQPPGAGLPFLQKFALRFLIGPIQTKRTPWETSRSRYEKTTTKILKTIENIPSEKRKTKILVDPIIGLEDSSRYWSVDMLLEHLLIVSKNIENIILALADGSVPKVMVDTARVKPTSASSDQSSSHLFSEFNSFAPLLMQRLDTQMKNRDSKLTLRHPWFGECTARQWYWVLAAHQNIHWQQLKQIKNNLTA